jgi:hypothetical protein
MTTFIYFAPVSIAFGSQVLVLDARVLYILPLQALCRRLISFLFAKMLTLINSVAPLS